MKKMARIIYHVYLTLTAFGMGVGVLYFWLMRPDFLSQYPEIEPLYPQYIAAALTVLSGALAQLKGRRWGIWALFLGMMGLFGIEWMSDVPWNRLLRIPVVALILFGLLRWNRVL